MSAAVLGVSQTSAFAAPVMAVPVPATAPADSQAALDNTGSVVTPSDVCFFETNGDYVHISSSAFEASGHGWWTNINCNTSTAVVTVQLQEYYSDGKWRNVGTVGRSTVRSGGGSGARATGRAGCSNRNQAGWRSVIDVDLVGLPDDPSKLTTSARNLNCSR